MYNILLYNMFSQFAVWTVNCHAIEFDLIFSTCWLLTWDQFLAFISAKLLFIAIVHILVTFQKYHAYLFWSLLIRRSFCQRNDYLIKFRIRTSVLCFCCSKWLLILLSMQKIFCVKHSFMLFKKILNFSANLIEIYFSVLTETYVQLNH